MIIKIERSGGVTGIPISNEMNVQNLPSTLATTAKNLMLRKSSTSSLLSSPRGAADHYTYKISIQDGPNLKVIECNQYTIQKDLKSLVRYIERNSSKGS